MTGSGKKFNEGKAIDAVIRRVEERDECRRANDGHSPECEGHAAPIDFACTISDRLYALEHTGIEPFTGQIEGGEHSRRLFGGMPERLSGFLPAEDSVELHVPAGATTGLRRKQVAQIQDALVAWVREMVPHLPTAPYGSYMSPIREVTVPGVPFPVSLYRMGAMGPMRGRFGVRHIAPDDLESARVERLRTACDGKFPKLAAWKQDHDAHTVLVLEDGDIQLTNAELVYYALGRAEQGRPDRPDEIYVVNTALDNLWWVTCLRRAGKTYYDDGERHWEVDPQSLISLTER
jgi:hypothetical protein